MGKLHTQLCVCLAVAKEIETLILVIIFWACQEPQIHLATAGTEETHRHH